jgi:hypothetical protein
VGASERCRRLDAHVSRIFTAEYRRMTRLAKRKRRPTDIITGNEFRLLLIVNALERCLRMSISHALLEKTAVIEFVMKIVMKIGD